MNVTGSSNSIYLPRVWLNPTTGKAEFDTYDYTTFMEKFQEQIQKQIEEAKVNPPEIGKQELSETEIKELAEKYNPQDMTQAEYDEFIQYLEEKGVLSRLETSDLGMSRVTIVPGYFETAYIWTSSSSMGSNVHSLSDVDGNALQFVQIMTKWKVPGSSVQIRQDAYSKVLGILNQMNDARDSNISNSDSSPMYDMSNFLLGIDHIKFEHNFDLSALIPDQNETM